MRASKTSGCTFAATALLAVGCATDDPGPAPNERGTARLQCHAGARPACVERLGRVERCFCARDDELRDLLDRQ